MRYFSPLVVRRALTHVALFNQRASKQCKHNRLNQQNNDNSHARANSSGIRIRQATSTANARCRGGTRRRVRRASASGIATRRAPLLSAGNTKLVHGRDKGRSTLGLWISVQIAGRASAPKCCSLCRCGRGSARRDRLLVGMRQRRMSAACTAPRPLRWRNRRHLEKQSQIHDFIGVKKKYTVELIIGACRGEVR